ncbi:hypothetical protein B0H13DRAFT_1851509 [Mycena leptocephala]|nr:hypothetical protein B0H13DRAFT_1851509 [Mycena leptocephala]
MQYTADVTETIHSTTIKVPARTETNHRDCEKHIARHPDRDERLRVFDLATGLPSSTIKLDLNPSDDADENVPVINLDVSSSTGESARPIRNLFHATDLHHIKTFGHETCSGSVAEVRLLSLY